MKPAEVMIGLTVLLASGLPANADRLKTRPAASVVDPGAVRCNLYGYAPHSHEEALCRANVRFYWSTGPCGSARFAAVHPGYCHLNPPPFL